MYLFRSHIFHSSLWQHPRRSSFLIDKKIIDPTKTKKLEPEFRGEKNLPPTSHTIHATGIFTYIWFIFVANVGEYISPMDGMGLPSTFTGFRFQPGVPGSGEAEALERLARAAGPAPPTSPHPALLKKMHEKMTPRTVEDQLVGFACVWC